MVFMNTKRQEERGRLMSRRRQMTMGRWQPGVNMVQDQGGKCRDSVKMTGSRSVK